MCSRYAHVLRGLLLGALAWLPGCGVETGGICEPGEAPRTIVLISLDTLRADRLGAYGYDTYPTSPVLDAFAAENVLFERSVVQEPRTLTSHMSLLTGALPQHHRVGVDAPLRPGVETLAQLLKAAGYSTEAFVDGGWVDRRFGFARGFDGFRSYGERGLDAIVPELTEWLKRSAEQRVFLFVHTYDVHSAGPGPWYDASPKYRVPFADEVDSDLRSHSWQEFSRRWKRKRGALSDEDRRYIQARYAEGVRHADTRVGDIFELLEQEGRYECAFIMVWSDHGEGLYDHDDWSHAELFDHTIRGPLLMRIPGRATAGQRVASVVSSVDIAPTILEIVGLPTPERMDGSSLLPLLEREDAARVAFSIRSTGAEFAPWRRFSVRSQRHHLVWDQDAGTLHFFDLQSDPGELRNLHPSNTEEEEELRRQLEEWIAAYDEALAAPAAPREELLDDEISDRLRALGYLEETSPQ